MQDSPIFSLHTEILQLIFEIVVANAIWDDCIMTAILLSGVCHRWRGIAVDTPRLWATLEVTARPEGFHKNSLILGTIISRIKATPATVSVCQIEVFHLHHDPKGWSFFQLFNLSNLTLEFCDHTSLEYFLDTDCNTLRYSPLQRLSVSIGTSVRHRRSILLCALAEIFPSLTHLGLSGIHIRDDERPVWTSLRHVDHQWACLDLQTVATVFPSIESLRLNSMTFEASRGRPSAREMTSLRHLKIEKSAFFQDPELSVISYPNLISLYNAARSSDELIAFLGRHPSLKHLGCTMTDRHVAECAKVAPQLTQVCLTASVDPFVRWSDYGLESPPFPRLEALLVGDHVEPFTAAEFEMLVRARFLPVGHSQSLLEDASLHVKELRVVQKEDGSWTAEDWANHPLCSEAKTTLLPYEEEEGTTYVSLRWS